MTHVVVEFCLCDEVRLCLLYSGVNVLFVLYIVAAVAAASQRVPVDEVNIAAGDTSASESPNTRFERACEEKSLLTV